MDAQNQKQSWMYKFAEQSVTKSYTETFADLDRYTTDLYDAVVSVSKHKFGISVGAQIYSTHIGVTSYCQYWHYKGNELKLANKTFEQIKEAIKSAKAEIEFNMLPMPSVMTIMRNKLAFLDLEHRENPIVGNNRYLGEQYEADWRSSLYGNRYPGPTLDTRESIATNQSESAKIEVNGNSSRNITYRFRYADQTNEKAKEIPIIMNQPKRRSKKPPEPVIRSFDSKQVEVFDKGANTNEQSVIFRYAFENIDQVKARQLLYRAIAKVGTNWKDIAKVLIDEYNVPKEMMSYINAEFLKSVSKMAAKRTK